MTVPVYKLELLERYTRHIFGIVEDGVARRIDGTEIPIEHIGRQTMPKDGQYWLSPAVCSGDNCSVGNPNPKCVKNGTYCPPKCAVYFFYKDIENCTVTVAQFLDMLDETLENIL